MIENDLQRFETIYKDLQLFVTIFNHLQLSAMVYNLMKLFLTIDNNYSKILNGLRRFETYFFRTQIC